MEDYSLLIDLHRGSKRQGPGGDAETVLALSLAKLPQSRRLKVLDVGCGTGASTLQLASLLDAEVTALDRSPEFIEILAANAKAQGLSGSVKPVVGTMECLPFSGGEFDLIWSEGAVYNMGFERGVKAWRHFLAPTGTLVVSELTWTTGARPAALQEFWDRAYPEVATAGEKIIVLEKHGYSPDAYFVLPEHCWTDNYYWPVQRSFPDFMRRNGGSAEAAEIVAAEEEEIAFYQKYKGHYSYGVYIARNKG